MTNKATVLVQDHCTCLPRLFIKIEKKKFGMFSECTRACSSNYEMLWTVWERVTLMLGVYTNSFISFFVDSNHKIYLYLIHYGYRDSSRWLLWQTKSEGFVMPKWYPLSTTKLFRLLEMTKSYFPQQIAGVFICHWIKNCLVTVLRAPSWIAAVLTT